jgi:hypothetical protein
MPIFFHHHTKCTSKISEFRTLPTSFHTQQQPTMSLSYHNHMSKYVITKISDASHMVGNPWTVWIGGAQTNGACGCSYRQCHTPISFPHQMNHYHTTHKLPFIRNKHFDLIIFIVVPCILKSILFTHQEMHYLLNFERFKIYTRIHTNIAPTYFGLRPSSGSLHCAWLKLC